MTALSCHAGSLATNLAARHWVTNVVQFRSLSGVDYLEGCDFRLPGVVTLVDTNREFLVVQDETGAVALNFKGVSDMEPGCSVVVEGTNCCPCFLSLPDYPYHASVSEIRPSFEAPTDWGEYHLTRMRGYLHPQVTGLYTFWIASDNSSELWLSPGTDPSAVRRIAFIPRYGWVDPHEWSRFPSQRSEPILLRADETYYVEALQEQTTQGDHLSVAWQGPQIKQSVIEGAYLTPWSKGPGQSPTNGMLLEYWTNFSAGNLAGAGGGRPFKSILSVEQAHVSILAGGHLPEPRFVIRTEPLSPEDNFTWAEVEGTVRFIGVDGQTASMEIDGEAETQVRVLRSDLEHLRGLRGARVRVQGVCEGVFDQKGTLMPGLIWVSASNGISLLQTPLLNTDTPPIAQAAIESSANANPAMKGFYGTRGIVTFNDRVFGKDLFFVQEDSAVVFLSLKGRTFKNDFGVGQWLDLGGPLLPGKELPVMNPMVITEVGWHAMPPPLAQSLSHPLPPNCDGKWAEVEGIVHAVNPDSTLYLVGKEGSLSLWVGHTPSNRLNRYVDEKLRARGVLSLTALDAPLLLVPSPAFIDVNEESPQDPFAAPAVAKIAALDYSSAHRLRISAHVTYENGRSFFVQDLSGGVRVQACDNCSVKPGEGVEVSGFPCIRGASHMLTDAVVRPTEVRYRVFPKNLDLHDPFSLKQDGLLVTTSANLLNRRSIGTSQVLELQHQQRIFTASLSKDHGKLNAIAPGSRLRITGVCDNGDGTALDSRSAGVLNILLRSPDDLAVLGGPPWWTWKQTATLTGGLLCIILVTLLWVYLLRRRLYRQQAVQVAFSRQVLERLEGERHRIAVNLHDSLGQLLLAIKNQALLAMQKSPQSPDLRKPLEEISGATSQALEEVRQITHGLRPYQLDRLGLTKAISAAVSLAAESSSIQFAIRVDNIDSLFDKDAEIHVYRIVQEAVNNVMKHSAATEATVVIKNRGSAISLSIRDNGQGFDPAVISALHPQGVGYGLSGISERVRILGGSMAIDSGHGDGTSVSIEIPVPGSTNERGNNSSHRG